MDVRNEKTESEKRSLVPLAIIILCAFLAAAVAFYVFLRIYNRYSLVYAVNEDGKTCTVVEITERSVAPFIYFPGELKMPETIGGGFKVTAIGAGAIKNNSKIKSVLLPEGVVLVDEGAFEGCINLESIRAEGLSAVEAGAFRGCISLSEVKLGEKLTSIGAGAFEGCASLTRADIPASVKTVGAGAFRGCDSLVSVSFAGTGAELGAEAFWGCASLAELKLGGVSSLGEYAFWGCAALTEVSLGSVKSIGEGAFSRCASLEGVSLENGTEFIGDKAFSGCAALESVSLPAGLRGVGECAFEKCASLKSLRYLGSAEQWENVICGEYWLDGSSVAHLVYNGGELALE